MRWTLLLLALGCSSDPTTIEAEPGQEQQGQAVPTLWAACSTDAQCGTPSEAEWGVPKTGPWPSELVCRSGVCTFSCELFGSGYIWYRDICLHHGRECSERDARVPFNSLGHCAR
jgi:hypothetical protein